MSDFSYSLVRGIGLHIYWLTSRRTILHLDRVPRRGPFILAASHLSPFDVFAMIGTTPRHIDFLSITELERTFFVGRFFRAMNCTFVDRGRSDFTASHQLVTKLRAGRVVAMFPEGNIRTEENSVIRGAPFKPGVVRLAQIAGVPIVPCVVLGTRPYMKARAWLPTRSVHFGVNYGDAVTIASDMDAESARTAAMAALRESFSSLAVELRTAMNPRPVPVAAQEALPSTQR